MHHISEVAICIQPLAHFIVDITHFLSIKKKKLDFMVEVIIYCLTLSTSFTILPSGVIQPHYWSNPIFITFSSGVPVLTIKMMIFFFLSLMLGNFGVKDRNYDETLMFLSSSNSYYHGQNCFHFYNKILKLYRPQRL